ncbi:hypothetical protein LUZ60_006676 [Juncus effusus]|nr:hypothetical protein LUZ60_006676 [Juncus effusus]
MSGGEAAGSSRSPLEKPLADLTEEDIAQVTREDCRRFLKERGMRRPSWNKSQAIQQVISLKALLEGRPGAGDPPVASFLIHTKSPSRILPTPSHDDPAPSVPYLEKKETSGGGSPPSQTEPSPYRRRDPPPPQIFSGGGNPSPPCRTNNASPPETTRSVKETVTNQLTIVYDGRINVYDGVSSDKAKVIMQLAANPDNFDSLLSTSRFPSSFIRPSGLTQPIPPVSDNFPSSPSGALKFPRVSKESAEELSRSQREAELDCPTSRKASLQRYFEKRKDRFKGKAILGAPCQSTMDLIYVNQKIRSQSNELRINNSQQIRPPQTPTQNQSEKVCFSFDLNDDACDY